MKTQRNTQEKLTVPESQSGVRVDSALAKLLSGYSRTHIRKMIEAGYILVGGKPTKASKQFSGGETVSVNPPEPTPLELEPEDIPLDVIYEDDSLVVVDKPAGMVVHPGAGIQSGTLVNALLAKCSDLSGIGGKMRPGIVHRLDKETSGIIIIAKDDVSHKSLSNQFQDRTVEKSYLAIVAGTFKEYSGTIDAAIGRHPTERVKMSTNSKSSRASVTNWRVVEEFSEAALVEARPKTGRTHQIRVHMKEIGHPILGDKVYGLKKIQSPELKKLSKSLGRQALHSSSITFDHPKTGQRLTLEAPLPPDMQLALNSLRKQKSL